MFGCFYGTINISSVSTIITVWSHSPVSFFEWWIISVLDIIKKTPKRVYESMAPPWGLSTQRAPEELLQTNSKCYLVAKQAFRARICTIFCMREATYISGGFHMRDGPLGA